MTTLVATSLSSIPAARVAPAPRNQLRLRRRSTNATGGFLDGGWWPHSRDLATEVRSLLAETWSSGYDVQRVIYHLRSWDPAPDRLTVSGRLVELVGILSQDPALMILVGGSDWSQLNLAVIPPGADRSVAEWAMARAGEDGDLHRPSEILELAYREATLRCAGRLDLPALAGWEADGGSGIAS
jgi:Family of unknown function (DUF5994)